MAITTLDGRARVTGGLLTSEQMPDGVAIVTHGWLVTTEEEEADELPVYTRSGSINNTIELFGPA